jgi:hypothetical protein
MSTYRRQFDERMPAIEQAINQMPGDIEEIVPGMTRGRLKRFFQRFSIQLGRLDKYGPKHPQHLVIDGQIVPQVLIANIDNAISHLQASASTFSQNSFYLFVRLQEALERAVGADPEQIKLIASSVAADLSLAVSRTDELTAQAQASTEKLAASEEAGRKSGEQLKELIEQVRLDADKTAKARVSVEQMVNPDGRNRNSLESLARRARERISEIDSATTVSIEQREKIGTLISEIEKEREKIATLEQEISTIKTTAEQILNLSSQAGLAASYKTESDVLEKRAKNFTCVLYGATALTLGIALFYVLPEISKLVTNQTDQVDGWEAFSLTLLRLSALAPLVYLIYFTTKRVSQLETLRMDYAEKAAASLAYSGYRDQMDVDEELLRQLKGSLLIKFAEHPERLLRTKETTTSARVKTANFEAETRVGPKREVLPPEDDE